MATRLSCRLVRLALRPVRFSSYRLTGGGTPFLSAHSPASFVGGGVDRFSFRLVPLLVRLVSCGVSSLFFAVHPSSRLAHQFAGGSLRRLVRRSGSPSCSLFLGVSSCPVHCFSSRVPVSSARLVKQSVFSRFVRRLVSAVRGVRECSSSRSLLFSSYIARCVSWTWRRAVRLSHLVAACLFPCCFPSWNPIGLMAVAE